MKYLGARVFIIVLRIDIRRKHLRVPTFAYTLLCLHCFNRILQVYTLYNLYHLPNKTIERYETDHLIFI